MTNTMKAVRIFGSGGPEVLTFADYPMPDVGEHDVRVRIEAKSVSGFDLKYRSGALHRNRGGDKAALPGRNPFLVPMQLGRGGAGIVEAVGKETKKFRPGDRVDVPIHNGLCGSQSLRAQPPSQRRETTKKSRCSRPTELIMWS